MVEQSRNSFRTRAATALATGIAVTWCIHAALGAWSVMDPQGHFQKMKASLEWIKQSAEGKGPTLEVNPYVEGAKSATIITIPFALGLLAALRFRTGGWKGVLIVGLLAFVTQWLLSGLFYGQWTWYRLLPVAATVAALPAGDWLARGKDHRTRAVFSIATAGVAFLMAVLVQDALWMSLKPGFPFRPLVPLAGAVKGFPRGFLPWLPAMLAWSWAIPPLSGKTTSSPELASS